MRRIAGTKFIDFSSGSAVDLFQAASLLGTSTVSVHNTERFRSNSLITFPKIYCELSET